MHAYFLAFLQKQKGKSVKELAVELFLRAVSLLIFPFAYGFLAACALVKPVRLGFLYHERLGHLALNTDLYLRRRYLGLIPKSEVHIFFVYAPANHQLVKMFSREILLVNSEFLSKLFAPIGLFKTRFWQPLPFLGNEYEEFHLAPPQISFTDDEQAKGKQFLASMGIKNSDWYVCFFARDHRYYEIFSPNTNVAFSDHRNADINSYQLAAEAIIRAGGWVVRMGSCVDKPFELSHPRVIDYASICRDDFADVYITAHARFFVGTTSGASDLAVLFDIPFVGVNWVPIGYSPFGKDSIFIPKRIVCSDSGKQIPIRLQLLSFTGMQISAAVIPEHVLQENKWRFEDNTDQELLDIVEEMLERVSGGFVADQNYTDQLVCYSRLLPADNLYRNARAAMGKKMLASLNWD